MERAVFIVVAVAIAGCAAPPRKPNYWVKPGGSEAEFNRTAARCRMQLAMVPQSSREGLNTNTVAGSLQAAGRDLQDAAISVGFMNDCLTAEGWTRQ